MMHEQVLRWELLDGNSDVGKVTYKYGVSSKIDLASRFPKEREVRQKSQKTAEKRGISRFSRSFAVFCELRVFLRSFRSISIIVLNICH